MLIIGVDYHPSFQQIAFADTDTGECGERRLTHSNGEAERFYRERKMAGSQVRAGIESTGHTRWFEQMFAELGFELWIGDPSRIRAQRVRKQKTDRQDAQLLLTLLVENRFPRIWAPDAESRDLRQLLWHRHRLVQMRTRFMNQLQAIAMNEGIRRKSGLWSQAEGRRPGDLSSRRPPPGTSCGPRLLPPLAKRISIHGQATGARSARTAGFLRVSQISVAKSAHYQCHRTLFRRSAAKNPTHGLLRQRAVRGPHHLLHLPEI